MRCAWKYERPKEIKTNEKSHSSKKPINDQRCAWNMLATHVVFIFMQYVFVNFAMEIDDKCKQKRRTKSGKLSKLQICFGKCHVKWKMNQPYNELKPNESLSHLNAVVTAAAACESFVNRKWVIWWNDLVHFDTNFWSIRMTHASAVKRRNGLSHSWTVKQNERDKKQTERKKSMCFRTTNRRRKKVDNRQTFTTASRGYRNQRTSTIAFSLQFFIFICSARVWASLSIETHLNGAEFINVSLTVNELIDLHFLLITTASKIVFLSIVGFFLVEMN